MIIKNIIESIRNKLFVKRKKLLETTSNYQITDSSIYKTSQNDFSKRIRVITDDMNSNIKIISLEDIDLKNSFFHFTCRNNLSKINNEGLKAQVGDASNMKSEKEPRVYMSKGSKGVIEIKNAFIYEFKKLRICDIPIEYRKYFNIQDYSKKEQVTEEDVYDAMEKRFKDEIYFKIDARENEDFSIEENFELKTSDEKMIEFYKEFFMNFPQRDVKGKENHNIEAKKLSLIRTTKGDTALDVIYYFYDKLLKDTELGTEDEIRHAMHDLDSFFTYIQQREKVIEKNKL